MDRARTLDAISALGLVAVTGYTADNMEQLEGTPWFPPAHRLPPVMLFDLDSPEALEGWTLSGEAFSVAPVPALFNEYTLNSLAKNGETAQGRALSSVFRLPEWCSHLKFDTQGGTAMKMQQAKRHSASVCWMPTRAKSSLIF